MKRRNREIKQILNEWIDLMIEKRLNNLTEQIVPFLTKNKKEDPKEKFERIVKSTLTGTGAVAGTAAAGYGLLKLYKAIGRGLSKIYDHGLRKEIMKEVERAIERGDVEKAEKLKQYLDMYEAGQINRGRLTALILALFTSPAILAGLGLGGVVGGTIGHNIGINIFDKK